ncbi:hypothetical protein CFC21_033516 [Triticum aestivum]|uniref:Uncharacterized protein n=3 Tax=Triticum aestivum TaxID=4565 RepID=A0A3B6ECR5_WHEAT|nr:eukaryotic translation initiation factor 3 subunit A-like [Triticum dicoccoides]KAF7020412.1 hypothetical protein CFC21_033516 [Triticum aestivum]
MAVLFSPEEEERREREETERIVKLQRELQRNREMEAENLYLQEQLREVELSRQQHAADLQEKNRLSRLLEHKNAFLERVVQRREAEFNSQKKERAERINQLISRKRAKETLLKLMYYLFPEEERIQMFHVVDARKREEEERRKREDAEMRLKLDTLKAKLDALKAS